MTPSMRSAVIRLLVAHYKENDDSRFSRMCDRDLASFLQDIILLRTFEERDRKSREA